MSTPEMTPEKAAELLLDCAKAGWRAGHRLGAPSEMTFNTVRDNLIDLAGMKPEHAAAVTRAGLVAFASELGTLSAEGRAYAEGVAEYIARM